MLQEKNFHDVYGCSENQLIRDRNLSVISQSISNDDQKQQISIRIKNKQQFACSTKQGLFH